MPKNKPLQDSFRRLGVTLLVACAAWGCGAPQDPDPASEAATQAPDPAAELPIPHPDMPPEFEQRA